MKALVAITVGLLLLLVAVPQGEAGGRQTLSKLTYGQWINLLRYAYTSLRREPPRNHTEHYNRTEHVQLIATSITKYFFNDLFNVRMSDDGRLIKETNRHPVDFLIMLDSSASIGSENYEKTLKMLTSWVGLLDEKEFFNDTLRVSMVTFSEPDKVVHEFPFVAKQDKSSVISRLNSTSYHNGRSTSTAQALWLADTIFARHSRKNATRVMLVATDGWSHNELQLPFGVLWPAARLKKRHGVKLFAVGIGNRINHNELKAIASKPVKDHLFEVEDYDMMLEVLKSVKQMRRRSD